MKNNTKLKIAIGVNSMMWLLILTALFSTGCSAKFEFGYHGQTGRDDQTVSKEFKGGNKNGRY